MPSIRDVTARRGSLARAATRATAEMRATTAMRATAAMRTTTAMGATAAMRATPTVAAMRATPTVAAMRATPTVAAMRATAAMGAIAGLLAMAAIVASLGCGGSRAPASTPVVAREDTSASGRETTVSPTMPSAHRPPAPPQRPTRVLPGLPPPGLPPPPGQPRELFPREPRNTPDVIVRGRDEGVESLPTWLRAGELKYDKKSDYWSPCVRDFVQTQPDAARVALGEALSLYSTSCTTTPARRVEFRTPRAGRGVPTESYLGLVGELAPDGGELALTAAYHGEPVYAERITLIADGARWSSPRIAFDRDDGWEIATLPLGRELVRVVQQAIAARDAVLRFEGARGYQDVIVTDEMKHDLRVLLDALEAINRL
jgi:hypothetical protein